MKIRVKVKWSFEDTEFERLRYPEAVSAAGLPKSVIIKDYDPEKIDIKSYLIKEYKFDPASWEISVKVKWSFEDTEFEHLRYPEAILASGLPKSVIIKDYDSEEIDIESYLIEEYQFDPISWEIVE